jgi:hypothetical protein
MKRIYLSTPCVFVACLSWLAPRGALAEVVCSSEITYLWQRGSEVESDSTASPVAATVPPAPVKPGAGKGAGGIPAPSPVPVSPSPAPTVPGQIKVRVASVERAAVDEAGAKAALSVELHRQKGRASERCKREHESFGECLATKLSVKASVLNSLSFSSREQLEKALMAECQAQQGQCLGVESSEPVCREVGGGGVATPSASPEPSAEASKEPAAPEPAKGGSADGAKKDDPKAKAPVKKK